MKNILEWVKEIIIAVIIASVILAFVKPIIIRQSSMEPTFYNGDYIFISKQAYNLFGDPERGDVVVFHTGLKTEEGEDKNLIKRIIGLPGDTVEIVDGYVYLNGEKLDEPYAEQLSVGECDLEFPFQVPQEQYFVLGDMRESSIDSRNTLIGCVAKDQIVGKVFFRIWPFKTIRFF